MDFFKLLVNLTLGEGEIEDNFHQVELHISDLDDEMEEILSDEVDIILWTLHTLFLPLYKSTNHIILLLNSQ